VAIISYDGLVEYGLLADYDALPDLSVIAEGIEATLDELVAAAAASTAVQQTRRRRSGFEDSAPAPSDVPLMGSTTKRRNGPGSDMRARHRNP
jgi:diacylglycerol O-acyltransferase